MNNTNYSWYHSGASPVSGKEMLKRYLTSDWQVLKRLESKK